MKECGQQWPSITPGALSALQADMKDYWACLNAVGQTLVSHRSAPIMTDSWSLEVVGTTQLEMAVDKSNLPLNLWGQTLSQDS